MSTLLKRLRQQRPNGDTSGLCGHGWTEPVNPDGEEAAARLEALERDFAEAHAERVAYAALLVAAPNMPKRIEELEELLCDVALALPVLSDTLNCIQCGGGAGTALAMLERIRKAVPRSDPFNNPSPNEGENDVHRRLDLVAHALENAWDVAGENVMPDGFWKNQIAESVLEAMTRGRGA